ncbi:unnamed protein product [Lathyrus oleraceus]
MSKTDIKPVVKPTIFREYIGMIDTLGENIHDFPAAIIDDHIPEFHFILGFARETYVGGKGTGLFRSTWNVNDFSPAKVVKIKKEHRNVKVVITIGSNDADYPFNPQNIDSWILNAVTSIKVLIQDYETKIHPCEVGNIIDGIDINYEYIKSKENDFSLCIGKVIELLKKDLDVSKSMKVVSISPTNNVNLHYLKLYSNNQDNIDWINYKFYNEDFPTEKEFVSFFYKLATDYGTRSKLLPGVNTNTHTPTTWSLKVFVDGCRILINHASLAGVFIWNANTSAPTYSIEKELLHLFYTKK